MTSDPTQPTTSIRIEQHTGSRAELRPLFEEAEDSAEQLDAYLDEGRVLVAIDGEQTVGHLQLTETEQASEIEIKNMAVVESHQRRGIGNALISRALELAREESRSTVLVATAAADIGNLRFYQQAGFRMRSIDRDAFTAETGYDGVIIDGIELRDRIWFDQSLDAAS